jgi:hypothetical protein
MVWFLVLVLVGIVAPRLLWHTLGILLVMAIHLWEKGGSLF